MYSGIRLKSTVRAPNAHSGPDWLPPASYCLISFVRIEHFRMIVFVYFFHFMDHRNHFVCKLVLNSSSVFVNRFFAIRIYVVMRASRSLLNIF